jgi:hypothetical protein
LAISALIASARSGTLSTPTFGPLPSVLELPNAHERLLLVVERGAGLQVEHREAEEDADEDERAGEHEQVVAVVVLQVHEVADDQRRLDGGDQHGDRQAGGSEVGERDRVGQRRSARTGCR